MEYIAPIIYFILFVVVILKHPFFNIPPFHKSIFPLLFSLKILAGICLLLIYTYYYTDRTTADIFKFFDDSKILYATFWIDSSHFFSLLLGIDTQDSALQVYTNQMQFWYNSNPNELYNDSRLMIKLNALIHFFSFGYYGVHLVIFTFLSFVGFVAMYKAFERFFETKKLLLAVVFLIPSVIFWSSGVLKESVLFFGLGLLVVSFFSILEKKNTLKNTVLFITAVILLVAVKPYVLGLIFPALIGYAWANKKEVKNSGITYRYVMVYGILLLLVCALPFVLPKYDALTIIATKQNNFINMAKGGVYLYDDEKEIYIADDNRDVLIKINENSYTIKPNSTYSYRLKGIKSFQQLEQSPVDTTTYQVSFDAPSSGSLLKVDKLTPTLLSFIKALPLSLYHSLFKPFLFSSFNPMLLMSGVENFVVAFGMLLGLFFRKESRQINQNLLLFCLVIAISILIFVGLTTPVMGSIMRYKIPALVFLAIGFLHWLDMEKLSYFLTHLKPNS